MAAQQAPHLTAARHQETVAQGTLASYSTDSVSAAQRADYWYDQILHRRLDAVRLLDEKTPFNARLTRLLGDGTELLQHSADSLDAQRDARRCRTDSCDDICIDLMAISTRASLSHAGARRMNAGDMIVMDLAQPVQIHRTRHQVISLFLPRNRVQAVIGDPAGLAGLQLAPNGLAAMLRSHMRATMDQAHRLQPAQRVMAVNMATEMALSILQIEMQGRNDIAQFATGICQAAKLLIDRECNDPNLTPQRVASALGCSRAGLYRAFADQGQSIAEMIWAARVARAKSMLLSSDYLNLRVSEIAFLSGFTDQSTFNRMFKRTYGLPPGEMRQTR